ncbi:unnamed protein product [Schistosoma curassoni]|uniref:Uncharacterized protein n=1 Tax=Schistosoma curassoni TaxID=6186 RepID=A0A183K752_9TREM|nr:unnamed protein product [Schistosoma curassoni]
MCPSGRNPHPPIALENDDTLTRLPKKEVCTSIDLTVVKHKVFSLPPHLARLEDPWNKLCTHHTLSSLRHTDFKLGIASRVLKNRPPKPVIIRPPPSQPFTIWTSDCRERLEHVSEAIGNKKTNANHTQATNGGYSRKPDGNKFIA